MKIKQLFGLLLAIMLLAQVGTALAFWHPPDDEEPKLPCAAFSVVIDGVGMLNSSVNGRFNMTEPDYGFCTDVTVEVWILDVEDLFAYEFKLNWEATYFELTSYTVEDVWPSQFVVKPDAAYDSSSPYHQAVSALAPSTGVNGYFKLATLIFHIVNDVCWEMDDVLGRFNLYDLKASNSCSDCIELCGEFDGWYRMIPMQPHIYLTPEEEINCVVDETFTLTIMVEDIVKMKSIHLTLEWYKYLIYNATEWVANQIICTTPEDVVLNEDVLGPADEFDSLTIATSEGWDWQQLSIDIVLDCDQPLVNGSFWLAEITFLKQDPWYCGFQPGYTKENHEWSTDNATTDILIWSGYFDVMCPGLVNIEFGEYLGYDPTGLRGKATCAHSFYTFDPVPGDLNGDGVVDIVDLTIICGFYGQTDPYTYPAMYYDFVNPLNIIDIFDVTVVAKNFGRTCSY